MQTYDPKVNMFNKIVFDLLSEAEHRNIDGLLWKKMLEKMYSKSKIRPTIQKSLSYYYEAIYSSNRIQFVF